jgi:hypothetical protein
VDNHKNIVVHAQAPVEYFKENVEASLARQHVHPKCPLTQYYLVTLLCQYVHLDITVRTDYVDALALRLGRGLQSGGKEQWMLLRSLGDDALFLVGFFSDSLNHRMIDADYYVDIGRRAYGIVSHQPHALGEVFKELYRNFVGFSDVLADINERTGMTSSTNLLRLYEKWLRTRSERDYKTLVEHGLLPNESIGPRFHQ